MTRSLRCWPFAALALAACFSSAPPAPPVRFFDPLPAAASNPPSASGWRVTAAPWLGREFVVRTAPREVVFDPLHSWVAAPRDLVAGAIAQAGVVAPEGGEVLVERFELDLCAAPRAHVRLVVRVPGLPGRVAEGWATAAGAGPGDHAAAMADALAAAVRGLAPAQ